MQFKYKVLSDGITKFGKADADNETRLAEFLKAKGMTVLSIEKVTQSQLVTYAKTFSKVSFNDIVDLTRKIAMMLNAGLTIIDSLDILKKQTTKPAALALIHKIDEDVRAGSSFSEALKKQRGLFSNLYISLVQAGEASGKLDEILLRLADDLDKSREFRGKLRGAFVYPALIVVGMLIVMFVMITFVIPQLLNMYKDFNIELPFMTKVLIAVSSFLQATWPLLIVATIGLSTVFKRYISTRSGKKTLDTALLKLPVLSNVIKMSALVDSTRTLAILIASGVSILDSLTIVIETTGNVVYQEAFSRVYSDVEKGMGFGKALENAEVFPPILVQMTGVGEQTGNLDDTLKRISRYFEMESDIAMKALTTLIEPSILLVLGVFVGLLVLSVITPIYNLTSSFK